MSYIQVQAAKCDICGHVWLPRAAKPLVCAKCHSRLWNGSTAKPSRSRQQLEDISALAHIDEPLGPSVTIEYDVLPERTIDLDHG